MAVLNRPGLACAGARLAGRLAGQAGWWLGERGSDALRWPVNLVRDWPGRTYRLKQSWPARRPTNQASPGASGSVLARQSPDYTRVRRSWVLGTRVFDLLGGPELAEFLLRGLTHATPLTDCERNSAAQLLGPGAVRWSEVRVAEGGILAQVFAHNGNRAFATWHTINLPQTGAHTRARLDIVMHELVHVYQYERVGSAYIVEALVAQGASGYTYGGGAGLQADRTAGRRYGYYNREQQAQIVQDYFRLCEQAKTTPSDAGEDPGAAPLAAYMPCIAELRAGEI
jgi:hypothetical protein